MPDPDTAGTVLGIHVVDAESGDVLLSRDADRLVRTASVAKVLVLSAVAAAIESGEMAGTEMLSRSSTPAVTDSGMWHLLGVEELSVLDVAALVGAVSDNWATNVLIDRLGLARVDLVARQGGLRSTRLHDRVRDHRGPDHPPTLSTGTAREWATVMTGLHRGTWVSPEVSARVLGWLAAGTDHSLVASVFERDPLVTDRMVLGKTGADTDVRCDAGLVRGPRRRVAYAALGNGDPDALVPALREVGHQVRELVGV